jgi:hypothetical protein
VHEVKTDSNGTCREPNQRATMASLNGFSNFYHNQPFCKVKSYSKECLTPSIRIHRAIIAFGNASRLRKIKDGQFDDRTLEVSEGLKGSSRRLTRLEQVLQKQADLFPELLVSFTDASSPSPVPESPVLRLAQRILEDNTVSAVHQPAPSLAPVHPPPNPATVPAVHRPPPPLAPVHPPPSPANDNEATRSDTAQNLTAGTQQDGTTGLVELKSNDDLSASDAIVDPDPAQSESGSRKKRKVTPISARPGSSSTTAVAAPMPTLSDPTSASETKATATPDSIQPDCLSDKQKGKRKATSATDLEEPVSQQNVTTGSQEGANGTVSANKPPTPLPLVRPTPQVAVRDPSFSCLNSRIVASGKHTTLRAECDYFTDIERLILYTRFRHSATKLLENDVYTPNAEQWYELWTDIAHVLPGRSVMNCIDFYKENEEHFWF